MTVHAATLAAPAAATVRPHRWASVYLVLAALLAPVLVPAGPGQTAFVDALNLAGLALFAVTVAAGGGPVRLPLLLPALLTAFGSLLAAAAAVSGGLAALALAQDLYLYLWFVVLVNLMRGADAVRRVQVAWVVGAAVMAAVTLGAAVATGGIGQLLAPRGLRASATLYNPNMFADYLVLSLFLVAGLAGTLSRPVRAGLAAVMLAAMALTKSNGGMLALGSGAAAMALALASARRARLAALPAGLLVAGTLALGAWWAVDEWRFAAGPLQELQARSFLARIPHSSESRMRIWDQLQRTLARSPLGIGPGNSSALTVSVEDRERPGSLQSKEAHSDYVGFLTERGPIGLAGLVAFTVAAFALWSAGWRAARAAADPHAVGRAAALLGALTATTVHSLVIEKLHFRHFWLFLALLAANALVPVRTAAAPAALVRERAA